MDVSSILILCLLLASAAHAQNEDAIKMIIKHGAREENLIASFSSSKFKRFYDECLCPSAWTQCIVELGNTLRQEQQVSKVGQAVINKRGDTNHAHSRRFICVHNETSEIIICSLKFDDDDDEDDDDNVRRRATEWFQMLRGSCGCVGIQWMYPGESVLSKNDKTSLRRSQNCKRTFPKLKTLAAKSSTTVGSPHRQTAVMSKDNNAQGDNLWIIITTVIVILGVIVIVLLFFVLKRRCSMKSCLTTCKQKTETTNEITSDSVRDTLVEQTVLTTDNTAAGVTQVGDLKMNATDACHKSGITVHNKTNRLCDDTDLCYVEINHTIQSKQSNVRDGGELCYYEINDIDQKNDNYDVIDDYENDHKQKMKVEGLAALKGPGVTTVSRNEDDEHHGSSGEDDVYEGYNDDACRGRFPDATAILEIKNIVEDTLYSSVDENCEVKYSSIDVTRDNTPS